MNDVQQVLDMHIRAHKDMNTWTSTSDKHIRHKHFRHARRAHERVRQTVDRLTTCNLPAHGWVIPLLRHQQGSLQGALDPLGRAGSLCLHPDPVPAGGPHLRGLRRLSIPGPPRRAGCLDATTTAVVTSAVVTATTAAATAAPTHTRPARATYLDGVRAPLPTPPTPPPLLRLLRQRRLRRLVLPLPPPT